MASAARKESKHAAFLRLMQARLGRALEEMRLVSQLSSINYENTPEEAEEVIKHLDKSLRNIASVFGVEYASRIGRGASHATTGAVPLSPMIKRVTILDEIRVASALDHLRKGELANVEAILRDALT